MPASTPSTAPELTAASRAASRADGEGARTHLSVEDVSHAFQDRRVLSGVSFTASTGDRVGLIGENGTGKSTLLRILAGTLMPDRGTVALPGSVGLLPQQLPYADDTPIATVLDDSQGAALEALARIETLGERLAAHPDAATLADEYARALDEAERSGAWAAEARRGDVVAGLGLGGVPKSRPIGRLSGGQRLRLALAGLLLEAPHLLLLDEPSNHLDDASAAYLERVLADWPGIVIVASHDRALLDAISTKILDLDPLPVAASLLADSEESVEDAEAAAEVPRGSLGERASEAPAAETTDDPGSGLGVRSWGVGYSAARAARRAELERWRERYAAELEEREALIHEIEVGSREVNRKHEAKSEARITRKFYADKDARVTARRARNARVRLEVLERDRVRRPPEPLRFGGFADRDPGAAPVAAPGTDRRDGAARGHDERAREHVLSAKGVRLEGRLAETSLELEAAGRIMLTGPNGAGKSTLLAILAGELEPDAGSVERTGAIGYLPQEVGFDRPDRTAEECYRDAVGFETAESRLLSSTGLLAPRDVARPIGALSVGQRRRVALATLVADPPPVLLLDEPTNHLSLTLVEELEEALRDFGGALIVASHDRWLRSRWEGSVMRLEAVRDFAGA